LAQAILPQGLAIFDLPHALEERQE